MENDERWRRRKIGEAQVERSKFSDHTNYRNTKSDSAKSISSLSPLRLGPSLFCLLLFNIFHLSYDPTRLTIAEVLPAANFPSMSALSTLAVLGHSVLTAAALWTSE